MKCKVHGETNLLIWSYLCNTEGSCFLNFWLSPGYLGFQRKKLESVRPQTESKTHVCHDESLDPGLYTELWDNFLGNTLKEMLFEIQLYWIKNYFFCPLILQLSLWCHFFSPKIILNIFRFMSCMCLSRCFFFFVWHQ